MPRISVIIPAYNCEGFLEKAAKSVLCQTYADLELIIVNDGSTDGTAQVCAALSERDRRVRVLTQENGGVSRARNLGLSQARGEYVAFVDADDWLEQGAYRKMAEAIEKSGAECAMCAHYRTWPDGTRETDPAPFETGLRSHEDIMRGLVLPLLSDRVSAGLVLGTACRFLFKRQRIEDLGVSFSGAYLEDELFLIEYFAAPTTLACVNEPLYNYLQNPASATRRYLPDFSDTFRASLEAKRRLVERYRIPVPEWWMHNSAWAGLLIAAANEFAPGSGRGLTAKARALKAICREEPYAGAIRHYVPESMNRNKTVVASLLRKRLYLPLAALYTYKNRNRE